MAVLKCKMCGGELDIKEGSCVVECMYCGTKQTIPKLDSEKKATLFSRANRLRFNCEFDKASGLYESIVAEFPEEAEAFWGLVLCKYGIEYVDDPATAKKIPTCHRSSFESVLEDSDYEQTLENADPAARAVYREEAKKIEELRQNIVEVSTKEQPYDIFICYKETDLNGERTIDSVIAQDVYTALTDKGYRVFFSRISLEDKLGKEYEPYIFAALNSAKIMLAFGTDYEYYNAVWVKNEWSRYLKLMATDRTKTLIPCYKGITAYDMPKEFLRLQSQDMGKVGALQDLLRGIEKIIPQKPAVIKEVKETKEVKTVEKVVERVVVQGADGGADTGSLLRRAEMFLEDGDFTSANTYAEKVLDILPECAEAYLIKLCCDFKLNSRANLGNLKKPFTYNNNYNKIIRFADESLKEEISGYLAKIQEYIEAERKAAEEARRQAEEKRLAELKAAEEKRKQTFLTSNLISAGDKHTVALKLDGTVVAVGTDMNGSCKQVSYWSDIAAVSAGGGHTVGLKNDGMVVACGNKQYGQCDVTKWRDIVAIAAGGEHTVGLKKGGTVVAVGNNNFGQCNVTKWQNIVSIVAGYSHTVGLRKDGTVVAVGYNGDGQCIVNKWRDIVTIAADGFNTVGLKKDGTVVVAGDNRYKQCNTQYWKNIAAISAGFGHTVGLMSNGALLAIGNNGNGQIRVSDWRDIVAISAGGEHTVGLKADGTVIACGDRQNGQCAVSGWKLFNSINTLGQELIQAEENRKAEAEARRLEEERRKEEERAAWIKEKNDKIASLKKEKAQLEQELANLKGLFTSKRRQAIQEKLAQMDGELSYLDNLPY